MEKKKSIESTKAPTDVEEDVTSTLIETQNQEIADLKELARTLLASAQMMHEQQARQSSLRETIEDVKADVKAAARAMLTPAAKVVNTNTNERDCCGDQPCGCVSKECCCFEIVLAKVRAAKPQIEPPDVGDIPMPPTINALEVQLYVTAGDPEAGFVFPGLASTLDLRANGLPGGPGPWVGIERVINRVFVKKGTALTTQVNVEVREHDEGVERPAAFKDEIGEASGTITLDCCMAKIYPPTPIDVYLDHGGEGGGMVQLAFYARRVCC